MPCQRWAWVPLNPPPTLKLLQPEVECRKYSRGRINGLLLHPDWNWKRKRQDLRRVITINSPGMTCSLHPFTGPYCSAGTVPGRHHRAVAGWEPCHSDQSSSNKRLVIPSVTKLLILGKSVFALGALRGKINTAQVLMVSFPVHARKTKAALQSLSQSLTS